MTEIGILACVIATMFGFVRVFGDHGHLGRLVVVATIASLVASLLRRRGTGVVSATLVHLGIGLVVIANLYLPDTVINGLPTGTTFTIARSTIMDEVGQLRFAVPPVAATTGLLVLLATLTWTLTLFADSAALRAHAPVQAVAPLVVTFIAVGVSQPGFERIQSIVVFAAATGLYALAVRHSGDVALRWADPPDGARRGPSSVATTRVVMSVVVLAALALVATIPPGTDPVLSLRNRSDSTGREVVSPFVSIRSLLGPRSDVPLFRADTTLPSYWRLTALDTYDPGRDIWVSTGTYRKTGDPLPMTTADEVGTTTVDQHFEMLGIGGPWIPTIFEAHQYRDGPAATFNDATSTLFADEDLSNGQTYDITSAVPLFSVDDLDGAVRPAFDEIDERLLRVPVEGDIERGFLDSVTRSSSGPYEALLALQETFRNDFSYSEEVDYSQSEDPVSAFLTDRSGFCQQFSSVFAIIARRLGLPSRVAVGFTMGEPEEPATAATGGTPTVGGSFLVRGRHAHAWPEVHFAGLGWVAFEPTPGRGNPATTPYTGVAAAQAETEPDAAGDDGTSVTSTPTSVDGEGLATTIPTDTTPGSEPTEVPQGDPARTDEDDQRRSMTSVFILLATLAIITGIVVIAVRRRRGSHVATSGDIEEDPDSRRLIGAWESALLSLAELDVGTVSTETPVEFSSRIAAHLGDDDRSDQEPVRNLIAAVADLARIETLRRYSPLLDPRDGSEQERITALITEADRAASTIAGAVSELTAARERVS